MVKENDSYKTDANKNGTVIMVDCGDLGNLPVLYWGEDDKCTILQIVRQAKKNYKSRLKKDFRNLHSTSVNKILKKVLTIRQQHL